MEKITIYTTKTCPFSRASKSILKGYNIPFKEIDVTDDTATQAMLFLKTGYETVPLIFFGEKFIGGYDHLKTMDERGELKRRFEKAA